MKIYTNQQMLMARLMANPGDFTTAVLIGVNEETWDSEELAAIWDAMMDTRHKGEPHDLVAFYYNCRGEYRDRLIDLGTSPCELRYSTVNIEWHIMKATGKTK